MSSYEQVKTILENKESKKGKLSPKSVEMYLRNLRLLNEGDEWQNLNYLKKTDKIIEKINKFGLNTQKNYYASIVSVLNGMKGFKKQLDIYSEIMNKLKEKVNEELDENKLNEKQMKKWGNKKWDDIVKIYNDLTNEIKTIKKSDLTKESKYNKLLNWVVASFYTLLAPRRNADIQFLSLDDKTKNWIDMKNKKIHFNIFKTVKTTKDEDKIIDINDDLLNVIKHWIKLTGIKTGDLLIGFNKKPLDKVNSINRILNKVFSMGSSDLRHLYLSSKYGNTLKEMKEDGQAMGHDLGTQKQYIKT